MIKKMRCMHACKETEDTSLTEGLSNSQRLGVSKVCPLKDVIRGPFHHPGPGAQSPTSPAFLVLSPQSDR